MCSFIGSTASRHSMVSSNATDRSDSFDLFFAWLMALFTAILYTHVLKDDLKAKVLSFR